MSPMMHRWRSRLWWLVPALALGVLLGIELGWGRQVHRLPEPAPVLEARPVTPALLPEYQIEGGVTGHAEQRAEPAVETLDQDLVDEGGGEFVFVFLGGHVFRDGLRPLGRRCWKCGSTTPAAR